MFWELPAEAPESWFLGLFFWHILISWATWLHSYIRSLGLIFYSFWKQPFYQGVQVPFMGGRSSQNKIWVLGVLLARVSVLLWPLSRTAVLNHWARFSLQGTCGNVWKSMIVTTEEMVLKFSGKRPRMLINTLQCRDRTAPLHNKYVSTPDISDAEVEKSWARECIYTHTDNYKCSNTYLFIFQFMSKTMKSYWTSNSALQGSSHAFPFPHL